MCTIPREGPSARDAVRNKNLRRRISYRRDLPSKVVTRNNKPLSRTAELYLKDLSSEFAIRQLPFFNIFIHVFTKLMARYEKRLCAPWFAVLSSFRLAV
jgi:hypothetical protein